MGVLDWLGDVIGGTGSSGTPMSPGPGGMVGDLDPMGSPTGGMSPLPMAPPAPTRPMPPVQGLTPDVAGSEGMPAPNSMGGQGGLYNPGGPPPPNIGESPTTAMGDFTGTQSQTGAPQPRPPMPPDPATDANPAAGYGGASMPPGIPLPRPRPAGADAATPPNAAPASGSTPPGLPPGTPMNIAPAVQSYQAAGGTFAPPGGQPDGNDGRPSLLRALGLSDNASKSIRGALGAGIKAAGNSAGKSPMQAFASGVGEGIEGGSKAEDKTYDQKIKYLQAAVAAQSAGDKAAYNKNYAAYLNAKLKNDTDKAASGKTGAWNKPDSQKFIDAQHALANDPEVKASQKLLEQAAKTGTPEELAAAQAKHTALIRDREGKYLAGVGLSPQSVADMAKNPPGTPGNPHKVTSQQDFDTYVKPGQAYVNPRDGKVYIRKGGDKKGGGESGAAPSAPSAPAPPGPMPGVKADDDE